MHKRTKEDLQKVQGGLIQFILRYKVQDINLENENQIKCKFESKGGGVYIVFAQPLRSFIVKRASISSVHMCPWFCETMGAPNFIKTMCKWGEQLEQSGI